MKQHHRVLLLCSAILVSGLVCGLTVRAANTNEFDQAKKKDLTIEGKITAIDTNAVSVTIQHKEKGPLTFSVPSSAMLFATHKKGHATLADFKVGDTVKVAYKQSNGSMVCDSMWQPGSNPTEKEHKVEKQSGQ